MTRFVGLAYCSKPVNFSFKQTDEILQISRRNNERDALSGALVYDNSTYLQWLEGGASEIRSVFERICRDPRHSGIKILTVQELDDRWFPEWSMTAAVTQDQTLRGLKLLPHVSLSRFDPFAWSEADVTCFMDALSDYLTHRPVPKSKPLDEDRVSPRRVESNPFADLDRRLQRML